MEEDRGKSMKSGHVRQFGLPIDVKYVGEPKQQRRRCCFGSRIWYEEVSSFSAKNVSLWRTSGAKSHKKVI